MTSTTTSGWKMRHATMLRRAADHLMAVHLDQWRQMDRHGVPPCDVIDDLNAEADRLDPPEKPQEAASAS